MIKNDCFGLKYGKCKVLKTKKCEGPDCGFYKTRLQAQEDQKKVLRRIKSLDKEQQINIIDLYYDGKMELLDNLEVD